LDENRVDVNQHLAGPLGVIASPWPFPSEAVFVALHRWQLNARFDGTKGK